MLARENIRLFQNNEGRDEELLLGRHRITIQKYKSARVLMSKGGREIGMNLPLHHHL